MIQKIRNLFKQGGFVRYLKNTSWVLSEKILRIIAALFIGVWVARYLGPKEFGILSYASSFVGIFAAFSTLGLKELIVRELVKHPSERYQLMGTALGLQTIGSTLLMGCVLLSIYFNDNSELTNRIIIILGLLTYLHSFFIIGSYFESVVKSKFLVIPSVIGLVISSILKVILILNGAPLMHFVYVLVFDIVFLTAGQLYFYWKKGEHILRWNFSKNRALSLLKDSWPLILSSIIISIYMKIDQVMIQEMIDSVAVGQYAAAVKLSEAWYFIPTVICGSLFPAIINAKLKSETLYINRLQRLYDLMVFLALSIVLPITLLSDWLVEMLYGTEFSNTGRVLSIHVWAGVFVFLGVSNSKWFISENLQRYSIFCLGSGMIVNVVLNFIFIPKFGIIGAAYATLISQFFASVFSPVFFKKTRPSFILMAKSLFFVNIFNRIRRR